MCPRMAALLMSFCFGLAIKKNAIPSIRIPKTVAIEILFFVSSSFCRKTLIYPGSDSKADKRFGCVVDYGFGQKSQLLGLVEIPIVGVTGF